MTLWRSPFETLLFQPDSGHKKAAFSQAACKQKTSRKACQSLPDFNYIGAQEGTRTPTKLLAST